MECLRCAKVPQLRSAQGGIGRNPPLQLPIPSFHVHAPPPPLPVSPRSDEQLLAQTMALYWANFARSGDPNVGGRTSLSATWPRFPDPRSPGHNAPEYLRLDLPALEVGAGRAVTQCAILDTLGPLPSPPVHVLGPLPSPAVYAA
eukprot:scaffold14946_cov125-Isochrysis_galbana.AAC.3